MKSIARYDKNEEDGEEIDKNNDIVYVAENKGEKIKVEGSNEKENRYGLSIEVSIDNVEHNDNHWDTEVVLIVPGSVDEEKKKGKDKVLSTLMFC
ncbi:hypothetical protein U1Q18_019160 [Sarracenia purpurea var. burkii]